MLGAALTEARQTADSLVADVSVRQLASTLGLARDTVARALLVLRRAAIVVPEQTRTGGGAFAAGRYAIHVAADVLALAAEPLPARSPARSRPRRVLPVEQLALLSV